MEGGGNYILYADDTSATQTGKLWRQLEVKLMRMLTPLFEEMKLGRLKVNEDNTGLIILGSRVARRRLLEGGGKRTLTLAGETIEPKPKAKSLGLLLSELNRRRGVKTSEVQLQAKVADETKGNCKSGPKEIAGTGSHHEQTTPASRGDQYGEKGGPSSPTKDAE